MTSSDEPQSPEPVPSSQGDRSDHSDHIRLAREEDIHIQRSIIRFIVGVTIGFIVSTAVMTLGVSFDQMWLFYTGMGMACLCMGAILLRL